MNAIHTEKHGNATIRIHGTADRDRIKQATERFLKKAEQQRRKKERQ